jgi:hypothetical protein
VTRVALIALAIVSLAAGIGNSGAAGVRRDTTSAQWPKIIRLPGGSTVRVGKGGSVVQRSRKGQVLAASQCESGAVYERWVKFMTAFQVALEHGDRTRVVRSVHYPLRWAGRTIKRSGGLLRRYDGVFAPRVIHAVLAANPRALFCQNVTQVMLDSGVIWGDDLGGRLAIVTVNPPAP